MKYVRLLHVEAFNVTGPTQPVDARYVVKVLRKQDLEILNALGLALLYQQWIHTARCFCSSAQVHGCIQVGFTALMSHHLLYSIFPVAEATSG